MGNLLNKLFSACEITNPQREKNIVKVKK